MGHRTWNPPYPRDLEEALSEPMAKLGFEQRVSHGAFILPVKKNIWGVITFNSTREWRILHSNVIVGVSHKELTRLDQHCLGNKGTWYMSRAWTDHFSSIVPSEYAPRPGLDPHTDKAMRLGHPNLPTMEAIYQFVPDFVAAVRDHFVPIVHSNDTLEAIVADLLVGKRKQSRYKSYTAAVGLALLERYDETLAFLKGQLEDRSGIYHGETAQYRRFARNLLAWMTEKGWNAPTGSIEALEPLLRDKLD